MFNGNDRSLEKFAYYGDAESQAEVEGLLKSLQQEVDARPFVDGLKATSSKSTNANQKGEEDRIDNDNVDSGSSLRSMLSVKEDELAKMAAEKEIAVKEAKVMAEEINRLKEALGESIESSKRGSGSEQPD